MVYKIGQSGNLNGRPKGRKNKSTLLKEERRAIFDAKIAKKWDEIIDSLPPQYVADQYMGKAEENLNIKGKITGVTVKVQE